ncbi:MAG TPA: STAS domain-containing protein [Terracidiphilus sp.]
MIDSHQGSNPGTRIFRITGPLTLSNVFGFQNALRNVDVPALAILDLTSVPYMDSAGMGAVVNYYTHCQRKGTRMIVAGVNSRARELFVLTKVHTIIPMTASIAEAEALS